jgi:hypothetical protein
VNQSEIRNPKSEINRGAEVAEEDFLHVRRGGFLAAGARIVRFPGTQVEVGAGGRIRRGGRGTRTPRQEQHREHTCCTSRHRHRLGS